MKHMQTPSHTFMAVKFDTTGNVERKPLDVVKKLSIVVTPGGLYRKNNSYRISYKRVQRIAFFFSHWSNQAESTIPFIKKGDLKIHLIRNWEQQLWQLIAYLGKLLHFAFWRIIFILLQVIYFIKIQRPSHSITYLLKLLCWLLNNTIRLFFFKSPEIINTFRVARNCLPPSLPKQLHVPIYT